MILFQLENGVSGSRTTAKELKCWVKANNYLAKIGTTFLMPSSHEEHEDRFWLTSHFANQGIWAFYGTDRSGVFAIESTYGKI